MRQSFATKKVSLHFRKILTNKCCLCRALIEFYVNLDFLVESQKKKKKNTLDITWFFYACLCILLNRNKRTDPKPRRIVVDYPEPGTMRWKGSGEHSEGLVWTLTRGYIQFVYLNRDYILLYSLHYYRLPISLEWFGRIYGFDVFKHGINIEFATTNLRCVSSLNCGVRPINDN